MAKWPASSDTSSATIGAGAVCTSGRLPIAMRVTLPRLGLSPRHPSRSHNSGRTGRPGPARPSDLWVRVWSGDGLRTRCGSGNPRCAAPTGRVVVPYAGNTTCSCTAREGKPVRLRRWSATVNGAPTRRRHGAGIPRGQRSSHRRDTRAGARHDPAAVGRPGSRSGKREPCTSSAAPCWVLPLSAWRRCSPP